MRAPLILVCLLLAAAAVAGPSPRMEPFAPLIGDWDCKTFSPQQDGTVQEGTATWSFWWILDGKGIMDEWRSPGSSGGEFVGVNIRHWNAKTEAYEARWLEANTLAWNSYDCRWEDGNFVMEGAMTSPTGAEGHTRITFMNLTDRRFDWRMDWSTDEGATWTEGVFRIEGVKR